MGRGDRIVREGECLASIAEREGFFWQTLWEHPGNAELVRVRESPYLLRPNDRLTLPPRGDKSHLAAVDQRHRFRRRGVPEQLRVCLEDEQGGRPDLAYCLEVGGRTFEGTTDSDGCLQHWVPATARRGTLTVLTDEQAFAPEPEVYALALGRLGPAATRAGARARLINLELLADEASSDAAYERALLEFQRGVGVPVSGELDEATCAALVELHGC